MSARAIEDFYLASRAARAVDLSRVDPADTGGVSEKKARRKLAEDKEDLDRLQQVLYADRRRRALVVLQAMDTGGKDGVVRGVFRSINPLGLAITSFKAPTAEERKRHFLWRIENALGGPGKITIFIRSHYEDILVPSVFGTFPPAEVESRYATINAFEKRLAAQGWIVLKFFLHISKAEQKKRLQARLDRPDKHWKWSDGDLKARERWPRFMETYGRILARTSKPWAPWYVIPADHKWFRDFAIARIVESSLKRLDLKYPPRPRGMPRVVPD